MNRINLSHNEQDYSSVIEEIMPVLRTGGVVVLPSDTVYAYVADATNQISLDKLYSLKNLPIGKPVSVFIGSQEQAMNYVEISASANALMSRLLPGPYTLILPSKQELAQGVVSDKGTLGIRIPDHPWLNTLAIQYGAPLTATSANNAGDSPHYSIDSLLRSISQKKQQAIDLVIDAGVLPRRDPSTVIDLSTTDPVVLRAGEGEVVLSEISMSEQDTQIFAQKLLNMAEEHSSQKPVVILLEGNFGVGKTVVVKAMAQQLGVDDVISPTFAIYYDYDIPSHKSVIKKLYHFDLFRVEDAQEYDELEIESLLTPGNLIAIEWAQKSQEFLQHVSANCAVILVHMERLDDTTRKLEVRLLQA